MKGFTMGQVLHGGATTTEAIRRAIQNSQASLRALSKRYGINQKTVAKWKKRTSVADLPTGANSDEAGHAFQFEAGRVFQSDAGHHGVVRMSQIHDVVEGWEGQETGWS
jgi:hypothetical protein